MDRSRPPRPAGFTCLGLHLAILALLGGVAAAQQANATTTAPSKAPQAPQGTDTRGAAAKPASQPLHVAVVAHDLAGVRAAIEQRKADPNEAVALNGSAPATPLKLAFDNDKDFKYSEQDSAIIYYLLCKGANPNDEMLPGRRTYLHRVAWAGDAQPGLVYALLLAGAEPNVKAFYDFDGLQTPLQRAIGYACDPARRVADQELRAAASAALLQAFGAKPPPGALNGCARCAATPTCALLKRGMNASDAAELRAGRLPASLGAQPKSAVQEALNRARAGVGECKAGKSG